MGETLKRTGSALAVAVIYPLAYLVAWGHSADQFFLPAGLRIAALLLLPYRLWPAIFLGDAAALMALRFPITEQLGASEIWPFASSLLLCPLVSCGPLCVRLLRPSMREDDRWLPIALLGISAIGVVSNAALNALLGGPTEQDFAGYLYRYSVGQYLAILIFVPPALLWRRSIAEGTSLLRGVIKHVIYAGAFLGALFVLMGHVDQQGAKLAILAAMLLPPIVLAFLAGWRGAAVGVAAANLSIGFCMDDAGMGNKDLMIFVAQQALAVVGTTLLVIGSTVSKEKERSARLRSVERRSLQFAMSNHVSTEQAFRERAESIARAQKEIDEAYRDAIRRLKAVGQFELAMQLTVQSYQNSQMLFDQAAAIYPMHIERGGLPDVLCSASLAKMLGAASVRARIKGDMSEHRLTCQLAAYRCICHAVAMLPAAAYIITVRAWTLGGTRGVAVRVECEPTAPPALTSQSKTAEIQLSAKTHAYGGAYKRRRSGIFFVLGEGDQSLRSGTTIQATPSAPLCSLTMKSAEL